MKSLFLGFGFPLSHNSCHRSNASICYAEVESTVEARDLGRDPSVQAQNASINIQRSLTRSTLVDVGYTGNWGYNQQLSYDINPIPIGTRAPVLSP